MKASALRKETRPVEIDFGEAGTLNLRYRPNRFSAKETDAMVELFEEAKPGSEQSRAFLDMLCELLVEWDLTDDNDQVYPLDPEVLYDSDVALPVYGKVMQAIRDDQRPDPEASSSSGTGSQRRGR